MTRAHDAAHKWRMYCDETTCETCSEPFDTEPPLNLFVDRGWFIAELWGDVCPDCLGHGLMPTAKPHSLMRSKEESKS
ncbi:hypothetical protein [Rhodococcus rhodochrous]|uniref:hypothetical protein n=1 Tax=Rhodococcus rhodochrous TaxID=1829 RepID=UPI0002DE7BEE|nr:hypothetical protein [Rhodococcus rhodochrous]